MRVVEPQGEYELGGNVIRFRCAPPWPLPGSPVVVRMAEAYGVLVHVQDIGGEGWIQAQLVGKATDVHLRRLTALGGSRSSIGLGTRDET